MRDFLVKLISPNTGVSSTRFSKLLVVIAFVTDWMVTRFVYREFFIPDWSLVVLVAAVLGVSVLQRLTENKGEKNDKRENDGVVEE